MDVSGNHAGIANPSRRQACGMLATAIAATAATCMVGCSESSGNAMTPSSTSSNADSTDEKLQAAFRAIDAVVSNDVANGFPSAQVAVMKNGVLVYQGCWGKVNSYEPDGTPKADSADVTDDILYDLASNTKMYSCAYALQLLYEQGKVDLDTPLVDILGNEFADDVVLIDDPTMATQDLDAIRAWKRSITVKDVMCHRAGFMPSPPFQNQYYDYEKATFDTDKENPLFAGYDNSLETRQKTFEALCKTPLSYEPRTNIKYSDADYVALCFAIEKITGMGLDDYLRQNFWEPLGLDRITYNPLDNGFSKDDCVAEELNGDTRDGALSFPGARTETIQGEVHDGVAWHCMAGVSGHAGMFATATQLAQLANLMVDGTADGRRYFSMDTIELFTKNDTEQDQWGLGWWRQGSWAERAKYFSSIAPETTVGHQGWTGTATCIDRENKLVVITLTNKINSRVTDPAVSTTAFDGNWFTTAALGFTTQLIYAALGQDSFKAAQAAVEATMDSLVYNQAAALETLQNSAIESPEITMTKKACASIQAARDQVKAARA